jgi:hypothetical protein
MPDKLHLPRRGVDLSYKHIGGSSYQLRAVNDWLSVVGKRAYSWCSGWRCCRRWRWSWCWCWCWCRGWRWRWSWCWCRSRRWCRGWGWSRSRGWSWSRRWCRGWRWSWCWCWSRRWRWSWRWCRGWRWRWRWSWCWCWSRRWSWRWCRGWRGRSCRRGFNHLVRVRTFKTSFVRHYRIVIRTASRRCYDGCSRSCSQKIGMLAIFSGACSIIDSIAIYIWARRAGLPRQRQCGCSRRLLQEESGA